MTNQPWDMQVAVDCDDPHELATWWGPQGESTPQDVERLLTMGARRIGEGQQGPAHWVILADPEGNEFCI